MKDNSSVLFYLVQYILCSKEVYQSENLWNFWVLRSKFVKFFMLILKRQIDSSPNFVYLFSFMKDNSSSNSLCQFWNDKSVPLQILCNSSLSWQITTLWILSSYFFKFGLKDPIKIPILSALEKICHIPYVIFQTTS